MLYIHLIEELESITKKLNEIEDAYYNVIILREEARKERDEARKLAKVWRDWCQKVYEANDYKIPCEIEPDDKFPWEKGSWKRNQQRRTVKMQE